jgi:hypothetical protein
VAVDDALLAESTPTGAVGSAPRKNVANLHVEVAIDEVLLSNV